MPRDDHSSRSQARSDRSGAYGDRTAARSDRAGGRADRADRAGGRTERADRAGGRTERADRSGARADRTGGRSDRVGGWSDRSAARSDRAGGRTDHAGGRTERAGGRAGQAGARGERAGGRADRAGGRADQAGGRAERASARVDRATGRGGRPVGRSERPVRSALGVAGRPGAVERRPAEPVETAEGAQRLQKVLAAAGIGSRRACEDLIFHRRVTVDGRVAQLGDKVDPTTAVIFVDGERLVTDTRLVYLAMNKPRGVVSTMADEKGRTALADFLDGRVEQRVYHVGRLDAESEGLLLLTNDGTLAHRLMHPSFGVMKTYLCEVPGPIPRNLGRRLTAGIELEDGPVKVDSFRVVDTLGRTAQVEITLHEGRKHIVRRLLEEVGHPVSRLVRTSIGPIRLGDLRLGRTRRLTHAEVAALFREVGD